MDDTVAQKVSFLNVDKGFLLEFDVSTEKMFISYHIFLLLLNFLIFFCISLNSNPFDLFLIKHLELCLSIVSPIFCFCRLLFTRIVQGAFIFGVLDHVKEYVLEYLCI